MCSIEKAHLYSYALHLGMYWFYQTNLKCVTTITTTCAKVYVLTPAIHLITLHAQVIILYGLYYTIQKSKTTTHCQKKQVTTYITHVSHTINFKIM